MIDAGEEEEVNDEIPPTISEISRVTSNNWDMYSDAVKVKGDATKWLATRHKSKYLINKEKLLETHPEYSEVPEI